MCDRDFDRREFLAAAPAAGLLLASSKAESTEESAPKKTLLFIGAHRDDAEFGAGGLMLKALAAGHRIVVIQAVSDYSNWPPTIGKEAKVAAATQKIARDMGVEKIELGYKYHRAPVDDEIKTRIARIVDDIKPDIALVMTETDYWTDHANIARAGKDGVMFAHGYLGRTVKQPEWILAYAAGFNQTYEFQPDVFVDTTEVVEDVARLWYDMAGALVEGKPSILGTLTLRGAKKPMELTGHGEQVLAAQCRWGAMCGVHYADAFRAIKRPAGQLW
ncbi:MAG TPA: PIG-L family deacetylase [Pirellulales bacterium]|nr:PIG-L family deacetylase [Pirellulales bacterium]